MAYVDLDPIRAGTAATLEGVRPERLDGSRSAGGVARAEETAPPAVQADAARMTLSRRGLNPAQFVDVLRDLGKRFFTMIGSVERMRAESERREYKRRPGLNAAGRLHDASD